MQNKNQISMTRKTLYGIILLGLFFSVFGAGRMPSAKAQEGATSTPTPEVRVQETGRPTPEGEARIMGGTLANPSGYPRQTALNNSHFETSFLSQRYLLGSDQFGLESQVPIQAESDLSAQALTLGAAGLSFRYVQTIGTTSVPYLADGTHLNGPNGLFIDSSGTLFVTEQTGSRVLAYNPAGTNTMILGHAGQPWHHDDFLSTPKDVAKDGSGNIWIVYGGSAIKEFDSVGNLIQIYPDLDPWQSGNTNDRFDDPRGLAFDAAGLMYVSDGNNHRVQVYDVSGATPSYVRTIGVTAVAKSDNSGFDYPGQIAFDSLGRLYVMDTNNYRVQRCTFGVDWTCSTFFGVTGVPGTDLTHLDQANGITINGSDIFIVDSHNYHVLKCTTSALCSLFAGVTGVQGNDNAHFARPYDVAVDSGGNVFVSEVNNSRIQKFNSTGVYQSTMGVTDVPYLTDNYHFNKPWGIALASDNSMYILENEGYRLIKFNSSGVFQWSVGEAGVYGSDNAHLGNWWAGVEGSPAIDVNGRIYVGDTGNNRVQIFNSDGSYYSTLGSWGTGNYEFSCPTDISISPLNGDIYVSDHCNQRIQIFTSSLTYKATLGATGTSGSDNLHFNYPYGVTVDNSGNIFVADMDNHRVQKCQLIVGAPGYSCITFAGVSGVSGTDFAHLGGPRAVKVDASGRVYVADEWNSRVQVFDASGAYLTTISGSWGTTNGDLISPSGLALDTSGNVYITDRENHRIQKFTIGTPGWAQVNLNGFGDSANRISTLGIFGNQLYAGTYNFSGNGAQLWRSTDGENWSNVFSNGFGNATNVGIDHLIEFNGRFYAGIWNATNAGGTNGGQIWRSDDGSTWDQVVNNGFGDPTNGEVMRMVVFNNKIYAGTWSSTDTHGAEIWSSATGDLGDWTKVVTNGSGNVNNSAILTMEAFNGYLYAGTYSWDSVNNRSDGCEVWRTDGLTWTTVADGFGDSNCYRISSLTTFGDSLYAAISNWDSLAQTTTGGQVWRCTAASLCDEASDWTQVIADGFGNSQNQINSLRVLGTRLYAIAENYTTGIEVWKTGDGANWQQVGFGGFGDSNNSDPYWDNSVVVFNNNLFIGTTNWANGGEIWRSLTPVEVHIGGELKGSYALAAGQSTRQNYVGMDSGPVKVESTNGVPIIAAIRDAWAVNGVTTSFSQLMGLPLEQLSNKYVFPGYNNVTLNEQLRIANVDTVQTTVTVRIGGVLQGTYTLYPPGSLLGASAVRINYPGLDSGPVVIEGTAGVKIIAAIREAWAVNGVTTSFIQLMGLPAEQLSNKYVFPAYNNVTLNEQLRIANVDTVPTTVTVRIGGVVQGTYTLYPPGSPLGVSAVRVNYAGLDSGPVIVEGTPNVKIISAIRDAWAVNGVTTSFSQLMGMPAEQLSNKYLFPAYNNVTLNEQLRISNVDTVQTTVTVTIGGLPRGTYTLYPPGSPLGVSAVRINYAALDSGPVVVEGTAGVDIISAIREAWAVNGVTKSFVQLMGLPAGQLSSTFLFPAYNNVTLNEQLRFGVP